MFQPTKEQQEIISKVAKNQNMLIAAFAGSGKTSTLKLVTETYSQKRFLYLAYNKSLEQEALKKFGSNVKSCTVHSLAYQHVGYKYRRKLALKFYLKNISEHFQVNPIQVKENHQNCYA